MASRRIRKAKKKFLRFICLLLVAVIILGALYCYKKFFKDKGTPVTGEISFHFLELGNEYAGDCIYVKAGDNDILIDAGSRASSVKTIDTYLKKYVKDGTLEYVIATHADQDHIAGFAANDGIFDLYKCEVIIDFPLTNKTTKVYNNYLVKRQAEVEEGATHLTALDCYNNQNGGKRVYDLSSEGNVKMEILYNYFYENKTNDENDYSVCLQFIHGARKFLFTGDLEKEGEELLVKNNNLSQVELFKAGHHGSKTSSTDKLLSVIKPKIVCVCCCAGSVEYTQNLENTFPTKAMIDRVSAYTDKVYVTTVIDVLQANDKYQNVDHYELLNGNIVVSSLENEVLVNCSNNNTLLKDTEWFKNNRQMPLAWS